MPLWEWQVMGSKLRKNHENVKRASALPRPGAAAQLGTNPQSPGSRPRTRYWLQTMEPPMRKLLAAIAVLQLALSGAAAQSQSATKAETLSLEQKTKISQLISKQTAPLASSSFSIAVDAVVPADIQVHSLPSEAEQLAPQVKGFGYVVVEEQIALIDQRSRKVEIVFPRWREP
jgi:Protein of unknown function (DUF1236)